MSSRARLSLMFGLLNSGLISHICDCQNFKKTNAGLTSIPWPSIPADVQKMNIKKNHIVETGLFPERANLYSIDVSRNKLNVFPQLFNVASQIVVLKLNHNEITLVPADELDALTSLEQLNLEHNPLLQFPDVSGPGNSLRKLFIYGTHFTEFPPLRNIGVKLEMLYIHEHRFKDFNLNVLPFAHGTSMILELGAPTTMHMDPPNIAHWNVSDLSLYRVRITCDCHVIWLKLMEEAGATLAIATEPCDSPPAFVNVSWTDIGIDDLVCKGKFTCLQNGKLCTSF